LTNDKSYMIYRWFRFQRPSVTNLDFNVTVLVYSICYAWLVFMQLTRDLFAIAKFLFADPEELA